MELKRIPKGGYRRGMSGVCLVDVCEFCGQGACWYGSKRGCTTRGCPNELNKQCTPTIYGSRSSLNYWSETDPSWHNAVKVLEA